MREIAEKQRGDGASGSGSSTTDPLSSLTPQQLKATQENLPIFLEAMWHVSVLDIERTLTAVTHKVSADTRARLITLSPARLALTGTRTLTLALTLELMRRPRTLTLTLALTHA